ncbi:hypothetical protein [Mitsuaria sp. GD03876]|uniref:hypothetical protein n=1 Tax=Mitsuaria sp. GD03876 TaxID=2975399 RepID=UPI002448B17D|nr:hypothetical protein [Mitsuaria sp. GD03876]MDH0864942.1 hypothetical protein [Mitsuaria sp. GD03876]
MWGDAGQRLKLRQLELQLRSAELRVGLVRDLQALERPMQWAERGHGLWRLAGSLPRLWRTVAALAAAGGLAGLVRALRRRDADAVDSPPGRIARVWAWVSLGWKVWQWVKPGPAPTAPSADDQR